MPGGLAAILFDLDGVILDSRAPIARSINVALERHGLAPEPEERLHPLIGGSLHDAFEGLLVSRGADRALIAACIEGYRDHYRDASLVETTLMQGIEDALERLGNRFALAVATSKPEAFARPILESLGVAGRFRAIFAPPLDATHHENKTRTVERAVAGMGLPAGAEGRAPRAAMVGDTRFDMVAGRQHGLLSVGVTWGIGSDQELRDAGAHHLVSTTEELITLLSA